MARRVGGDWFFPSPQETALLRWGGPVVVGVVVVVAEDGNSRGERRSRSRALKKHPRLRYFLQPDKTLGVSRERLETRKAD